MLMAIESTLAHVVLEPASQAFVEATANPPFLYELTPDEARKVLDDVQAAPIDKLPVDERWIAVAADVGDVQVRVVRPAGAEGTLPVILYMHGGGWVLGNAGTHDRLVRELAVGAGAAVVFVEYERSPEARYPVAIEQGYATARWILREGAAHGLDPERMSIAGDSVGGGMTAALALMAQERGDVRFVHQSMYYPVTDAGMDTGSYAQFAEGYFLTAKAMAWFWDCYCPDLERRAEPFASPLRADDEQLAGLPPALLIVDEADVLRDEGEAYAARLRAAGVAVTTVRYDGITHDFMMLNPLSDTCATRAAVAQAIAALRQAHHSSKETKHEIAHRPHPRPLAHPAQLGGLEGAVRAARTRGPHAGLAPHGRRGRGPPPRPVRHQRAWPRRGRRPLRPDHPRPRRPAGDHGALHRRPTDRAAARPRPRYGRRHSVAGAGEGRAARAAGLAAHGLPGAPQPGEPKEDHPDDAQAVPLPLHQHHERRGRRGGLRALLRARPRPGGLPGGVGQPQPARRHQGRFPQGRPPAAARDRQRSGPHDPGLGQQGGREAPRQVEGRRGVQGVRRTPPLHGRSARQGSGGRRRARLGEPPRRRAGQDGGAGAGLTPAVGNCAGRSPRARRVSSA